MTEPIVIFIVLILALALFWIFAEKIYQSHRSIQKNHPYLFKVTGFNEKYLDNRQKWIKRFRVQLILMGVFFAFVMWVLTFGLR